MSPVNVSVLISDEYLDRIWEVVSAVQTAGMTVEQILTTLGVITGACDAETMATLAQIEGVAAVELQHEYRHESVWL